MIAAEEGVAGLFKGIGPRVGWITLGGYVFFGAYEKICESAYVTSLCSVALTAPAPTAAGGGFIAAADIADCTAAIVAVSAAGGAASGLGAAAADGADAELFGRNHSVRTTSPSRVLESVYSCSAEAGSGQLSSHASNAASASKDVRPGMSRRAALARANCYKRVESQSRW